MLDYKSLAKTAALNFIQNDVPLNCSITKLAESNDLNPSQIQRLCEISNKAVHQYCLLKTADKNFTFNLADSGEISKSLNNYDSSLLSSFEPKPVHGVEKIADLFGNPEDHIDTESDRQIEKLADNLNLAIKELESRATGYVIEKLADVAEVKEQMKHMVNNGIDFEDMRQAVVMSDPDKSEELNKFMKSIQNDIGVKSGTPATSPENAKRIVYTEHPLVLKVKNIFAKEDTINSTENARKYLIDQKDKLEERRAKNYT